MDTGKELECQNCGVKFFYSGRGRPPKYCKKCAKEVEIIRIRITMSIRRKKESEKKHKIGTTNLFEHPHSNFGAEYNIINKEIKKLGFKRQFT